MPTIVICTHTNHLIRHLGLLRQLRFRQHTHVDHRPAPLPVHIALRSGAELRALHADDRAAIVQHHALPFQRVAASPHDGRDALVEGVGEGHVADDTVLEEGERPDPLGAIDHRVRHHEVARLDFFAERADGREGDDGPHADGAERRDVGACGHFVRGVLVVDAVAGEEGDGDGLAGAGGGVLEDGDWRGGSAPRGAWVEGGDFVEVGEVGEAGAADYCDSYGLCTGESGVLLLVHSEDRCLLCLP